jgi:hypothetical protein
MSNIETGTIKLTVGTSKLITISRVCVIRCNTCGKEQSIDGKYDFSNIPDNLHVIMLDTMLSSRIVLIRICDKCGIKKIDEKEPLTSLRKGNVWKSNALKILNRIIGR